MFILLLILFDFGTQAYYLSDGYHEVINGDITDFSSLFLRTPRRHPTYDKTHKFDKDSAKKRFRRRKFNTEDYYIKATDQEYDAHEFNELNTIAVNLTRRWEATYPEYYNPFDWHWFDWQDKYQTPHDVDREVYKKKRITDLCISFIVHIRYQVYAALKQREPFRQDKRYKLGYLFNRLRRLHVEQHRFYGASLAQNNGTWWWTRSLMSLLRNYEQIVRMDVDIRDTHALIKEVYKKEDPVDFYPPETTVRTQ